MHKIKPFFQNNCNVCIFADIGTSHSPDHKRLLHTHFTHFVSLIALIKTFNKYNYTGASNFLSNDEYAIKTFLSITMKKKKDK